MCVVLSPMHDDTAAPIRQTQLFRWRGMPVEKISSTVCRQIVWGQKGTLARFCFAEGTHLSAHRHESEQHTCVLEGAMRVIAGDAEIVVRAGEVLLIPASVEHEVWVLEDSLVFDFFAPPREDWRAGHDGYLVGR